MAKQRGGSAGAESRVEKRVATAWARMGLEIAESPAWHDLVARRFGARVVHDFGAWLEDRNREEEYGTPPRWMLEDFNLTQTLWGQVLAPRMFRQVEWLARQLSAHARAAGDTILVEIGGGMGISAAAISSALRCVVVSVDPLPDSSTIANRFAELAGGAVEAHEVSAQLLPHVLDGRRPAALYSMGTLTYLNPVSKPKGRAYSSLAAAQRQNTKPTNALIPSILTASLGAPLYAVENASIEWLISMEQLSRTVDYHLEPMAPGALHLDRQTALSTFRLAVDAPPPDPVDLLAVLSRVPAPQLRNGLTLEGAAAEHARLTLGEGRLRRAHELVYRDASARVECAAGEDWSWVYTSTTLDYREIELFASEKAALEHYERRLDRLSSTARRVERLPDGALTWEQETSRQHRRCSHTELLSRSSTSRRQRSPLTSPTPCRARPPAQSGGPLPPRWG